MGLKILIKRFLYSTGLWHTLNLLRSAPSAVYWFRTGLSGVAPHPIKMKVIGSYLKKFSIDDFIETGTYHGDTLDYIARSGIRCTSIELSQEYYNAACLRFKDNNYVRLVQGDSAQKLPELLEKISRPVCFWLDGHYSFGITASAVSHTPISTELKAILNHQIKQHVILIDDARCFDGTNNYPYLDELLSEIRQDGSYNAEISMDIIRLVPKY